MIKLPSKVIYKTDTHTHTLKLALERLEDFIFYHLVNLISSHKLDSSRSGCTPSPSSIVGENYNTFKAFLSETPTALALTLSLPFHQATSGWKVTLEQIARCHAAPSKGARRLTSTKWWQGSVCEVSGRSDGSESLSSDMILWDAAEWGLIAGKLTFWVSRPADTWMHSKEQQRCCKRPNQHSFWWLGWSWQVANHLFFIFLFIFSFRTYRGEGSLSINFACPQTVIKTYSQQHIQIYC